MTDTVRKRPHKRKVHFCNLCAVEITEPMLEHIRRKHPAMYDELKSVKDW
jgi:hypothetical protein